MSETKDTLRTFLPWMICIVFILGACVAANPSAQAYTTAAQITTVDNAMVLIGQQGGISIYRVWDNINIDGYTIRHVCYVAFYGNNAPDLECP